jgi:hypothetical protein
MPDPARVLEDALTLTTDDRTTARASPMSCSTAWSPRTPMRPLPWSKGIRRRVDEIEAGTAELENCQTVRARLEAASRP